MVRRLKIKWTTGLEAGEFQTYGDEVLDLHLDDLHFRSYIINLVHKFEYIPRM